MSITPPADAVTRIQHLVQAGAEIEQRSLDGEPLFSGPLARNHFRMENQDGTETLLLWFIPLQPPTGYDEHQRPVFEQEDARERPLPIVGFNLIGEGNVGLRHESGTYSVLRPANPDHRTIIDQFDTAKEHGLFT